MPGERVATHLRVELLTFRGVICHWAARGETRVAELDLKTVQDGRAAALADKIWRMLLEARVAQPVPEAEAVRLARELYGIEATARALPGEYDDNFHLTSADGQEFVLKVMHPARERSFIDLQCRALTHLAQRAPHLPLPRVTPNRQGELFASIAAADGSTRLVGLLTFLRGKVLAEGRPPTPQQIGHFVPFLAWLVPPLASFLHPPVPCVPELA